MVGAMLSKSLIQFSADGGGGDCVPFLLFDLRPNYGEGNEGNGYLLQKVPCTHCYTQEMGIPGHLTCLLGNLYAGQEATVRA